MQFFQWIQGEPLVAAFLVVTLAIGLWAGRDVRTIKAYAVADRNMGTGVLTMTVIATFVGGWTVIQYPFNLSQNGIASIYSIMGYPLSILLAGLIIVPKLVYFSKCYTLASLMGTIYGKEVRIFSGLITFLAGLVGVALQIIALGKVGVCFGVDENQFVWYMSSLFIIYTALGGMKSVSYTDVVQFLAMTAGMLYITHWMLEKAGGIKGVWAKAPTAQWSLAENPMTSSNLLYTFYLTCFPSFLMVPGVIERMLTARDKRQARYICWGHAIFFLIFIVLLIPLFTLSVLALKDNQSSTLVQESVDQEASLVNCILGKLSGGSYLFIIAVLAMLMSTLDTYLSASSLTLAYDVIAPIIDSLRPTKLSERSTLYLIKVATFLCGLSAALLASQSSYFRPIHDFYQLLARILIVPCMLPLLGIRGKKRDFLASCVGFLGILLVARVGWLHGKETVRVVCSLVSLACFMLSHIHMHGGIMTVSRSHQNITEQLWLPSKSQLLQGFQAWYNALRNAHERARDHFVCYGSAPYAVGFFLAMHFMVPQLHFARVVEAVPPAIFAIKLFGALLVAGLWLESLWPLRSRYYFPLYYYLTIGYCLPFMTTLLCLHHGGTSLAVMQWGAMLLLLSCLANWALLMHLLPVGVVMALACFRIVEGCWLPAMDADASYVAIYLALLNMLILLTFGRLKEQHMERRVHRTKLLAGSITHEVRGFLSGSYGFGNDIHGMLAAKPFKETKEKDGKHTIVQVVAPIAEQVQAFVDHSERKGKHAVDILNTIDASMRSERFDTQMDWFSVKQLVEQALQTFFEGEDETWKKLKPMLDDDFKIFCSASLFSNVISNFVKNAELHGDATEISFILHADSRTLVVRDNGKGIPPENLPRVFDLFYTSDTKPFSTRKGLGCAFIKGVLEAWNADITVESQQGEGSYTRFEITFPSQGQECATHLKKAYVGQGKRKQ